MKNFSTLAALAAVLWFSGAASAELIDFDSEGFSGPGLFAQTHQMDISVHNPGSTYTVLFQHGTILKNTSFLPADQTAIYGTAGFAGPGYQNPLVINFGKPIENFIVDLFNGSTIPARFTVSDNAGNSATFLIPQNLSSGEHTFAFAASGGIVTVHQDTPDPNANGWDFFVDNIRFNEPLPGEAPEPASLLIFGAGAVSLPWILRRKQPRTV
jgi:hypothetical protein